MEICSAVFQFVGDINKGGWLARARGDEGEGRLFGRGVTYVDAGGGGREEKGVAVAGSRTLRRSNTYSSKPTGELGE